MAARTTRTKKARTTNGTQGLAAATEPNAVRTRWGGFLLAGASVLTIVAVVMWMVALPNMAGLEAAERAGAIGDAEGLITTSAWLSVAGNALVGLAAFFLVTRMLATRTTLPGSAAWLLVAFGGILLVGNNLVWATAMTMLAANYAAVPIVFEAAEAAAAAVFGTAVLLVSIGFGLVFWAESRATNAAIPSWACYGGLIGSVLGVPFAIGVITGLAFLEFFGFGFFLMYLAAAFLGLRIIWPAGAAATETAAPVKDGA